MKFCGVPSKISNSQILKKIYGYNELWYKMFSAVILSPVCEKNTVKHSYNEKIIISFTNLNYEFVKCTHNKS